MCCAKISGGMIPVWLTCFYLFLFPTFLLKPSNNRGQSWSLLMYWWFQPIWKHTWMRWCFILCPLSFLYISQVRLVGGAVSEKTTWGVILNPGSYPRYPKSPNMKGIPFINRYFFPLPCMFHGLCWNLLNWAVECVVVSIHFCSLDDPFPC